MAKELTCDDRVALKGWEKFSQSKEKELDSIVKTVMEKHAMGLVRNCSSFNDSGISSKWDRDDFEAVKYRLNRAFNVASCAIRKLDPHHNRGPISRSDIMKIIDKNMRADDDRAKLTKSVLSKLEGLGYELI